MVTRMFAMQPQQEKSMPAKAGTCETQQNAHTHGIPDLMGPFAGLGALQGWGVFSPTQQHS